MRKLLIASFLLLSAITWGQEIEEEEVDASNPLSKGWNIYQIFRIKPNLLDMQNIVNFTTDKWFYRGAIDYNKAHPGDLNYGSTSFLVAKLFKLSPNNQSWKSQLGVGVVISDSKLNGFSGGVNLVGIQSNKKWKFVELFTYQVNNTIEAQYGIYYKFTKDGLWEVR
ncbi:hypothetical protein [Flavobacterium agrisoli]|uniref:Uncharacterized protein n=1 Tax=Flavobacterium agrisoli TaxID=2793066 RepID=A0A934PMB0_9FLAO|nr:hypothetical protein [Flavobacterium agrisoli]MBK0369455.1 hypothetical protein [Flavobacterium agrisoli]